MAESAKLAETPETGVSAMAEVKTALRSREGREPFKVPLNKE